MYSKLPSLNALRYFEAAARHLSFKRAAAELSVSPPAVSHQIKALEDQLGLVLFRRFPRRLELTPPAEQFYAKVREGLASFTEGIHSIQGRSTMARLGITAPPAFAMRWLVPRLSSFTDHHKEVTLHLTSSTEMIDDTRAGVSKTHQLLDTQIQIRYGIGKPVPGYRLQTILHTDYVLVCAPSMRSILQHPEDIRHFVQIHDDTIPDERLRPSWYNWCSKAGINLDVAASGPHFHDYGMVLAAVADGMGTALSPRQLICQDLATGRIIAPFDISVPSAYSYYLVVPEVIHDQPEVQAFCTWIALEAHDSANVHSFKTESL